MSKPQEFDKVDIVGKTHELALLFKQNTDLIEKSLVNQGETLLAFYQDPNFRTSFQNLKKQKAEVLNMAIQDISNGVMTLRNSTIGISFRGKELKPYVSPHGSQPSGTVVFSISWKNIKAF